MFSEETRGIDLVIEADECERPEQGEGGAGCKAERVKRRWRDKAQAVFMSTKGSEEGVDYGRPALVKKTRGVVRRYLRRLNHLKFFGFSRLDLILLEWLRCANTTSKTQLVLLY